MNPVAQPIQINRLQLKNRFLRSATMEYLADLEGLVTDDLLKVYYDLARGGSGLIVTGCAAVEANGRAWAHQLGVWDDRCLAGLRRLATVIRTYGEGSKSAVQLAHQGSSKTGYSYGAAEQGYSLETVSEADLIGLCRPLICEPDLPRRLLSTPDHRPARCTSCNQWLLRIARQPVKCVAFDPFQEIVKDL